MVIAAQGTIVLFSSSTAATFDWPNIAISQNLV
jgi:hypothetical protein